MLLRACYRNRAGLDYFSPYVGYKQPHTIKYLKLIVDRIQEHAVLYKVNQPSGSITARRKLASEG
jgi:hypothetical protein